MRDGGFVARLNQACDDAGDRLPPKGLGRQAAIARHLDVSEEAVRKWFAGEARPRRDLMRRLSDLLGVEESWLALGETPQVSRTEVRSHARRTGGAALLVRGMVELAGGACAEPSERDPRAGYVDFYCIKGGRQYAVHVALAREVEEESGRYQIVIPREYPELLVVGVVPAGRSRCDFILLPTEGIDRLKARKAGAYVIDFDRQDGPRYTTDGHSWPRVRNFDDLEA